MITSETPSTVTPVVPSAAAESPDNGFAQFMQIVAGRRSSRFFDLAKVVPSEVLLQAVEAARWAPSACNKQAWDFVILNDRAVREKIAREGNPEKPWSGFIETPALIYCLYDSTISPEKNAGVQSASAAIQNLLLALHALGLAACWYNEYGDAMVRKYFRIPEDNEIIGVIRVGYPSGRAVRVPPRRKLSEIAHINTFKTRSIEDPNKLNWEQIASLQSQRVYTTAPEIGFVLVRHEEEQSVVRTILKETPPGERIVYLMTAPGEFLFPLVEHADCKSPVQSLELTEATIDWMVTRRDHLGISTERLAIDQWTTESLAEACRNCGTLVLSEVFNKLSHPDRIGLMKEIAANLKPGAKMIVLGTNPLYRLGNFSLRYTRKAHMGAYEYLKTDYLYDLLENNGFNTLSTFGIDLFPSVHGIRKVLERRKGRNPRILYLTRPLAWLSTWLNPEGLEGYKTTSPLRHFTKVVGGIFVARQK